VGKDTYFTGQPVFNQLLQLIPKHLLSELTKRHNSDHYYKSFKTYDHLITMLYCCFHRCASLREVVSGMQASHSKLLHLGLANHPKRSTLSDGNKKRSVDFFEDLYHALFNKYYTILPDSIIPKEIHKRLFIMDSTTIKLFSDIMKGAGSIPLTGQRKGGAKAHVLLQAQSDLPCFIRLTHAAKNDKVLMGQVVLPPHSILVFDRAYRHYKIWEQWSKSKITWVTRSIGDEYIEELKTRKLNESEQKNGVLSDHVVMLGRGINNSAIIKIRKIRFYDAESQQTFDFFTNNFRFKPSVIASIYKQRWQIEIFFKRFKQHNPLRYFLGDNENAIKIQIWCSFIADLLIKIVMDKVKRPWSFSNISGIIRHHLMNYFNLYHFLNNPDTSLKKQLKYNGQLNLAFDTT